MAARKPKTVDSIPDDNIVDRWTGNGRGIICSGKNTPTQQKAIDEINRQAEEQARKEGQK